MLDKLRMTVRAKDFNAAESDKLIIRQQRSKIAVAADLNNFFSLKQVAERIHISFAVAEMNNGAGVAVRKKSLTDASAAAVRIRKNKNPQTVTSVLLQKDSTYQLYYRKGGDSMNKDNFSVDELLSLRNKGSEEMLGAVQDKLSEEKKNELFRILGDKKALEKLLQSEQAQQLMKKFGGK